MQRHQPPVQPSSPRVLLLSLGRVRGGVPCQHKCWLPRASAVEPGDFHSAVSEVFAFQKSVEWTHEDRHWDSVLAPALSHLVSAFTAVTFKHGAVCVGNGCSGSGGWGARAPAHVHW